MTSHVTSGSSKLVPLGNLASMTEAAETGVVDGSLPSSTSPDTGHLYRMLD
jgi:hypothetical protein